MKRTMFILLFFNLELSNERTAVAIGHNRRGRAISVKNCRNPEHPVGFRMTKSCMISTCTKGKGKAKWRKTFDTTCCNHNGKGYPLNTTISTKQMSSGCDWTVLKCVDKRGQPIIEVQELSNCTITTKCSCPTTSGCNHTTHNASVKHSTSTSNIRTTARSNIRTTARSNIITTSISHIRTTTRPNIISLTHSNLYSLTRIHTIHSSSPFFPSMILSTNDKTNALTSTTSTITQSPTTSEINEETALPMSTIFTTVQPTFEVTTGIKFTLVPIQSTTASSFSNLAFDQSTTSSIGGTTQDESFLTGGTFGMEVSLIGSPNTSEGNVHIGNLPVCDDDWDLVDANVTCRMLGFPGAISWTFGSEFGNVPENFLMSHVNCSGQEDSLLDCPHQDGDDCDSCMAAGVVCESEYKFELRGGSGLHNGNLFFGNRPICDNNWDIKDAKVACRMLGFHGAYRATLSSEFGPVPENFMMGNVGCLGNESSIKDCPHNDGWACRASDGAGVVCLDTIGYSISLKEGKAAHRGHVFIGNFPVCSDGWDLRDASVACRMLGYSGAERSFEHDLDCDRTSDSPMITDFGCSGIEHSLQTCPHVVNNTCEEGRAGVICYPANSILNISLSYKEKAPPHGSGQGNVFFNNRPVCDDAWDDNDAKVACKMLGYSGGTATIRSHFGNVPANFLMDDVQCLGTEASLSDCPKHLGDGECGSHEGAGVICSTAGLSLLRLVGGTTTQGAASGNVYLGNSPVCGTGWDMKTANLTCRMLGYSGATKMSVQSLFGEVTTSSMVYDIKCRGDEWSLAACSYKEDGDCPASVRSAKGAGVVCQGYNVELRGGSNSREGDVYITNQPLFHYNWGTEDANVICRMLGFTGVKRATTGSTFVGLPRYTRYKAYNFGCSGSETNLADCPHTLNYYTSGSSGANGGSGVVCYY